MEVSSQTRRRMLVSVAISGIFFLAALATSIYLTHKSTLSRPITSAQSPTGLPAPTLSQAERAKLRQAVDRFDNLPPEAKSEIRRLLNLSE